MEKANIAAYDAIADAWQAYRRTKPLNRCIADLLPRLKPGARILDAGCGAGEPVASSLCEAGFHVTGIDPSPKMIEKAKELSLPGAQFFCADFMEYETQEIYDAIIAFDSLWHIDLSRQEEIYPQAARLLAPGGWFLFTHGKSTGAVTGRMFGEAFFYNALDLDRVHGLLEENGFEIAECFADYAEETTGMRDLLILARKK